MNGSIEEKQLKRGGKAWRLTVELGRDSHGKRKRKVVTVKGTKAQAQQKLRELCTAIDRGLPVDTSNMKLSDYLDDWLSRKETNLALSTFQDYQKLTKIYLKPKLGHIPISKLTPHYIESLHSWMEGKGLSPRTIQYTHRILSQSLKRAVRLEMLARNVCEVVETPRLRRKEMKFLTPEQVHMLLEVNKGLPYWPVFFLAIYTGLRKGELLGLRWQDVSLHSGTISVNQTVGRITGKGMVVSQPKTYHSRRTVSLPPSAQRMLIDLKLKQKEQRESGHMKWDESAFVFCNADGGPLSPERVSYEFRRALKRAKLPPLRFHDTRHTHASLMLKQGVNPKIVSERLGHTNISITLDVYSHLMPGMQEEAARAFDEMLNVTDLPPISRLESVNKL